MIKYPKIEQQTKPFIIDIQLALSVVAVLLCLVLFIMCILSATNCDMYQQESL